MSNEIIEGIQHGISYKISQETLDDLANHYGINVILEIERGIDLALKGIDIKPEVNLIDKTAKLNIVKYDQKNDSNKADMIKKFREQFGCGIMEAKKLLVRTNYDYDKAIELYRANGFYRI